MCGAARPAQVGEKVVVLERDDAPTPQDGTVQDRRRVKGRTWGYDVLLGDGVLLENLPRTAFRRRKKDGTLTAD